MGLKTITEELARAGAIMGRWADGREVSDIERELVLDKLKSIYGEVMFFQREEIAGDQACPEALSEPRSEAAPGPDSRPESCSGPQMESRIQAEEPAAATASLFEEEEVQPAAKVYDRRVILSLYGESPAKPVPAAQAPEPVQAPPASESAAPEPEAPAADKAPAGGAQSKAQVLGEVINAGRESLGEVFSKQPHPDDVATRLASARTQSLRRSIGINDKFLITSELFGGDAAAYERTLDELEAFEDLDELMIHIHENYSWNPNGEATRVLIEVLTRKLS